MLVKVFEAEEMSAALKMVKETLGPDALILSTRTVRKGKGVFGKPLLEVTAAVESPAFGQAPPDGPKAPTAPSAPLAAYAAAGRQSEEEPNYREIWKQRRVIDPLEEEVRELKRKLESQDLSRLKEELDDLKGLIRQLAEARSEVPASSSRRAAAAPSPAPSQELAADLVRRGLDAETAQIIATHAGDRLTSQQLRHPALVEEFLVETVAGLIQVRDPFGGPVSGQRRLALVGPTGVGKTTTLAKLAAAYLLQGKGRAALVTIDTYRVAAVEQLRVYGDLMNLPVEVVLEPGQLQEAFARHRDKDLILIDTAGRSPRDEVHLEELEAFLGPESETENHLVLAAPTRDRELEEAVLRFGRLPLQGIVFTKLDECEGCGSLLNLPLRRNLPVSYLANGQRVPEDLMAADPVTVAGFVLGRK